MVQRHRSGRRGFRGSPECGPWSVRDGPEGDASTWGWAVGRCETDPRSSIPRKEVIQPHLPVRLPCYDFVPIAGPALGGCPPEG